MKLIVGLGNPGRQYQATRHNIGFLVINALSRRYKISLKKYGRFAQAARLKIDSENAIIALPLSYMNSSGLAVKELTARHKIDNRDVLAVCDDMDLEFGRFRIKASGSAGGHKGLLSIIEALKTQEFCRLRIGIGRPPRNTDASVYVLSKFRLSENKLLDTIIDEAVNCCRVWAAEGVTKSMNLFNPPRKQEY
jgi:PTH1 family peptidyl-tRNA hydrolase